MSHLDCNILAGLIGVWSLFIHSVWLATYLLYLIVSSVLVTVAFLELVTSAVNILKVRNYFFRMKNVLLLFWHAFMCLFIHSVLLKQCAETVSHMDCNILTGLIGVWSLFIHSVWLATYLLYLIVSSVLVTVAFLESVTSAVNILKVRNYFFRMKNVLLLFWHAFMCLFIHSV